MLEYPSWLHPVIFKFGFIEIRWYSMMYLLGFLFCYFTVPKLAKRRNLKISEKAYDDMWIYLAAGIVVGARLGVLLYSPMYYLQNPLEIFAIWNGGMAFHGGLMGGLSVGLLFSRKYKIPFWDLVDLFAIPISLALFFGRLGNFANAELWGKVSDVPWAVRFPTIWGYRHPTQIYESLKNLFIFFILISLHKKLEKKPGAMISLFMILYAIFRFIIEFFKDNTGDIIFNTISLGQVYCVLMVIAVSIITYKRKDIWFPKGKKS